MDKENELKMAIIAGASYAIRYKEKHPRATEDEVIQHIAGKVKEILQKIDNPL